MDRERFSRICQEMDLVQSKGNSIGTLHEKTMHAVLKKYYEEDIEKQEVRVGRYVADIFTGAEIIEIQTRQLNKLREKLDTFLERYPVTVVYPVSGKKWVYWVDLETREISKGRISPKHGSVYDAFYELYRIKPFLVREGITVRIPVISVQEYKYLNGWSWDKKRGATRMERIPVQIEEEIVFRTAMDYASLVPSELKSEFTCKEFAQCVKISEEQAQNVIHILWFVGCLQRNGKRGRAYLYKRNGECE